jgi:SAM-dependent methyltransferase
MHDYTGPHDYFDESYVREWAEVANVKRPFRAELFAAFAGELARLKKPKVLDVGSGPGFSADYILTHCDVSQLHLFDFSPHMLELSRTRLAGFADRVCYHRGSFLDESWWTALPAPFDAIVSMQAIHEVRNVDRIPRLYSELRLLLRERGVLLIADQVNSDDRQEEHFLTVKEHEAALFEAGFKGYRQIHAAGDLVLFGANR